MNTHILDRWGFLWSEVRLVIAAVALFLGGISPAVKFFYWFPLTGALLMIAWLISGAVSIYLIYRWLEHKQHLFGAKDTKDSVAFIVNVVSGINLGLAGLLGRNIGMSISSNYIVFLVVGIVYLVCAYYLYTRWNDHGEKLF